MIFMYIIKTNPPPPSLTLHLNAVLALAVITVVMYIDYINFHPTLNEWSSSASASFQSFGKLRNSPLLSRPRALR